MPGRRVVVVMTDGRDENAASTGPGSTRTWDEVLATARATGATVYAIGFGTNVDTAELDELTRLTGGEAYFTNDITRARAALPAGRRRPAPPLHPGVYVHQLGAERRVARRGHQDRGPGAQGAQPRRLLRAGAVRAGWREARAGLKRRLKPAFDEADRYRYPSTWRSSIWRRTTAP